MNMEQIKNVFIQVIENQSARSSLSGASRRMIT